MKSALLLVGSLTAALATSASAGEVKLQLTNGRVTLQARDASVREILSEWAKVGQVKIVNADKIAAAPITLELQGVPESQALNTVLRSVSGYVAAPRLDAATTGVSTYDRIVIMAAPRTASTTAYTSTPNQPNGAQNSFRGAMPPGLANPQMLDDQDQPVGPPPTYAPQYAPAPPPPPQQPLRSQPMPSAPTPGQLPTGAPGTVSPMPQTPGVPGQQLPPGMGGPGGVAQPPVRRPGGPGGPGGPGDGGEGGRN